MLKKKIYQVGGCVRDKLLNIKSSDIDYVAIGYNEDDFSHLQKVGKDFPVFLDKDGSQIALARIEKKISTGYNGFKINTSNITLQDDLKRRDLTINSIAYDEKNNKYIDPYNGIQDIKNKILKHTSISFKDDPLRVLRLARFQAKFSDFTIDSTTKELVKSMKDELKYLQKDRVYQEIQKVLKVKQSELFFSTLLELEVLDIIFPNLYNLTLYKENSIYHKEPNVFIHTMMVLQELYDQSNLLKITALFHDIAKPLCYKKSNGKHAGGHDNPKFVEPLIDFQLPTKLKKQTLFLIQNHIKIFNLKIMRANKIATFFESYKKDKDLFIAQLILAKADINGRIKAKKEYLNNNILLKIFDQISLYSPKQWITMQKKPISGEKIKQHIHKVNIKIILKYKTKL